ncbi:MAG: HesA/MoeB/ThiF family protein [Armatimonadota bacterium]
MSKLTKVQMERYSRQLMISDIGIKGQAKLLNAKVLVIGAGGLGSVNLLYLTAAGVGNIAITDDDKVQLSNLQRQILYSRDDIGKYKVDVARKKLEKLNEDVKIKTFRVRLDETNARDIFKDYDIIVDCTDNMPARLVINKFACKMRKKWSYGAIFSMEGQASTIIPGKTVCYRCLFEDTPDNESIVNKTGPGVIGVIPAVIGSIQATEVIKLIIGKGKLLTGKLLVYQALDMSFDTINVKKRKNCPVCGKGC